MKNRISFLFLLLVCIATATTAQTLTKTGIQKANRLLRINDTVKLEKVALTESLAENSITAYNAAGSMGYIVFANDANGKEHVLAYSREGKIDAGTMPEAMKYMLELMALSVKSGSVEEEDVVCHKRKVNLAAQVEPLLDDIAWGQDYPFNQNCPTKTDGSHYYVGCVATAATQIMRYHQWPQSYDWANMPTAPSASSKVSPDELAACSALAADFGNAVHMEYLAEGSAAASMEVPQALRGFGYQEGVRVHRRNCYSTSEWTEMIRAELTAGRPVYYGASSDNGTAGHAFVCDGYDADGYFHINWGWYGTSNGYFLINHFDPSSLGIGGGTGGYNRHHEIVTGISPTASADYCEWPIYGSSRLACNNYGTEATFMTIIENYETMEFNGEVAVVAMRGADLLKVLHKEEVTIEGFKNNRSGYTTVWLRNVPIGSIDAEDGNCEVRLAIRDDKSGKWMPIRHEIGFVSYVDASIKDKKLTLIAEHMPTPDVRLVEEPVLNGPVIVDGAISLNMKIENMSADYRLKNIVVRLKNTDTGASFDIPNEVNIYDESTEAIKLNSVLPAGVTPGDYEVTFFEKGFDNFLFDDSEVGRMKISIADNPGHPLLRLTQPAMWASLGGNDMITQGDGTSFDAEVRNFGPAGTVRVQCWLQDINNPEREYIFHEQSATVKTAATAILQFYRKMPMDAGKYRLVFKYLAADGSVETETTKEVFEVVNPIKPLPLEIVSLDMPEKMVIGERYPCSVTVKAVGANYSGTFYVRLRQFTNTKGEIAYMGRVAVNEGEETTVSFNYRPAVEESLYMPLIDYKVGSTEYIPSGFANYYRIFNVSTTADGIQTPVSSQTCNHADSQTFNLAGQKVGSQYKGIIIRNGKKVLKK